jgi:hypothetical protein
MGTLRELITNGVLGTWLAALLTIIVYSYLVGDNPLYRLAEHLFVGSAVGYAAVVAWHSVLVPRLIVPLAQDPYGNWHLLIPLALGVLLLTKAKASWAWLGNSTVAFILGVGVAVAVGGALLGSLFPQLKATIVSLNPAHYPPFGGLRTPQRGWAGVRDALIIVVGTLSTLLYFYFTTSGQSKLARVRAGIGRLFILVTFGAIFANTVMSRISLLIGRVRFLMEVARSLGG